MKETERVFQPWQSTECDGCSRGFEVTRVDPKIIIGDVFCPDCLVENKIENFKEKITAAKRSYERLQEENRRLGCILELERKKNDRLARLVKVKDLILRMRCRR